MYQKTESWLENLDDLLNRSRLNYQTDWEINNQVRDKFLGQLWQKLHDQLYDELLWRVRGSFDSQVAQFNRQIRDEIREFQDAEAN